MSEFTDSEIMEFTLNNTKDKSLELLKSIKFSEDMLSKYERKHVVNNRMKTLIDDTESILKKIMDIL